MKKIKAKRSLGQNFMKSDDVLADIVEVSNISEEDVVLEVGPGKGALTHKILERNPKKLIIVEKDHRLIQFLKNEFGDYLEKGQIELYHEDILDFNFDKHNLMQGNFKVVANLPYYITGKFLRDTLESESFPSTMVLLLQKEVVERITQKKWHFSGQESLLSTKKKKEIVLKKEKENMLSLSVKAYGDPFYVTTVTAENFDPAPKVDSAVLLIQNISKDFFVKNNLKEKSFFAFLKLAFSSKRKKVIKNLVTKKKDFVSGDQIFDKSILEEIFLTLSLDKKSRPEDLSLNQYLQIYNMLK